MSNTALFIIIFISILLSFVATYMTNLIFFLSGYEFSCKEQNSTENIDFDLLLTILLVCNVIQFLFYSFALFIDSVHRETITKKTASIIFLGLGLILSVVNIILSVVIVRTIMNRQICQNSDKSITGTLINQFINFLFVNIAIHSGILILIGGAVIFMFYKFSK